MTFATKQKISPNVIIEFARLYGFQVDFQRDIRKNDSYQIIYETFIDENNEVFSTGEIIYANLVLRGQTNQLYFYSDKKFGHDSVHSKHKLCLPLVLGVDESSSITKTPKGLGSKIDFGLHVQITIK